MLGLSRGSRNSLLDGREVSLFSVVKGSIHNVIQLCVYLFIF